LLRQRLPPPEPQKLLSPPIFEAMQRRRRWPDAISTLPPAFIAAYAAFAASCRFDYFRRRRYVSRRQFSFS
jgi:hypothetical protein